MVVARVPVIGHPSRLHGGRVHIGHRSNVIRMVFCVRRVGLFGEVRRHVFELIDSSIPREEQLPRPLLTVMSLRKHVDFLSYHEGDELVGTSYSMCWEGHAFVLYIAVDGRYRSKGYGSMILSHLRYMYDGAQLTLNVEPLDPSSDNAPQRERRFSFYLRNGFSDTGYELFDGAIRYTVLSTAEDFDPDGYRSVLRSFTPGFELFRVVAGPTDLPGLGGGPRVP